MKLSAFGEKLTARSGILQLMDDLGKPLPPGVPSYQLGGGNPARIPGVEKAYRREMERILSHEDDFENAIARYDAPQGRISFIENIATYLSKTYGWKVKPENVAITNGSQSAFFYLFNLFSGTFSLSDEKGNPDVTGGRPKYTKTILFPLMPEYIGYADQGIQRDTFVSVPSRCEEYPDHTFKYFIDFPLLEEYLSDHGEVGAMCVSRPTNPSGNVLTDEEIHRLSALAGQYHIPLFVDNAYGLPFPNIVFTEDAAPLWDENIVLSMSLSKIGLPSIRTGIVIAKPQIISAIANINAIVALASGSLGQVLAEEMIKTGELVELGEKEVKPFYQEKSKEMQDWIHQYFEGTHYAIHKSEGSIFTWLYLKDLSIPTIELYHILKEQGVITVPGEYFFFGHEDQKNGLPYPHPHYNKCLRLNYSRPAEEVREGVKIIAETYKKYAQK